MMRWTRCGGFRRTAWRGAIATASGRTCCRCRRSRGYRVNGKVVPVDERYVGHWNHDPWRLDQAGDGRSLGDGASYLLPYYLGRYAGLVREEYRTHESPDFTDKGG